MWPLFTMQKISMYLCLSLDWYWANTVLNLTQKVHCHFGLPYYPMEERVRVAQRRGKCHSQFLASPWKEQELLFYTYKVTQALVSSSARWRGVPFLCHPPSSSLLPTPQEAKLHGSDQGLEPAASNQVLPAAPLVILPFLAEGTALGKKREGECPQLSRRKSSNYQKIS